MKAVGRNVLVRPGKMAQRSGIILQTNAESYIPGRQFVYHGTITAIPDVKYMKLNKGTTIEEEFWIDLKVGDEIWYKSIAIKNADQSQRLLKNEIGGNEYFIPIELVMAYRRNGVVKMNGPFCLMKPLMESLDSIKTKSGIFTGAAPDRVKLNWVLVNKGQDPEGNYPIVVGDIIGVNKDADGMPVTIDGEEFSCIRFTDMWGVTGHISMEELNKRIDDQKEFVKLTHGIAKSR